MFSRTKQVVAGTAAVAALAMGGSAIAGAAGTKTAQHGAATVQPRSGETALTGETAEKVRAAALAELPGATVLRVETDRGGIYEAHVRRADGTEVEVKVNKAFEVTALETHRRGDRRGHRGPGGGVGETALTGETAAKVKAAALAEVPGGTVLRVETDRGGVYEAHVRRADGTEVEVKVNKAFAVTAVDQHDRP